MVVEAAPPYTQNTLRDDVVELTFGEPDPAMLPVGLVRAAANRMLAEAGPGALAYGQTQGPSALREQIARRLAAREGRAFPAHEILVSGGNSQALDLVFTILTAPGDVVLVESPTYNLALGILRDHPVEVVGIPLGEEGLDVDALERTLARLRTTGARTRLLYTIPTFHNPSGVCLAPERRRRLLEIARHWDLILVEDDVYRELAYDGRAPPSLSSAGPEAPVVCLGSFSKSLAPGLRVGWINARRDIMQRLRGSGMIDSGGCPSQFAATRWRRRCENICPPAAVSPCRPAASSSGSRCRTACAPPSCSHWRRRAASPSPPGHASAATAMTAACAWPSACTARRPWRRARGA